MSRHTIFTFIRSGKTRAVAICGATALAMVTISPVAALNASDDSVTSGETEYIQPKSYDVDDSYKYYTAAAQLMDGAAVVYKPTYTAGLKRTSKVKVVSEGLKVTDGKIEGGQTYVGASYGTNKVGFTLHEKLVDTIWNPIEQELFFCAGKEMCNGYWWRDLITIDSEWGKVGNVKITVGEPGEQSTVTAQVYAKCGVKSSTSQPQKTKALRCEKSDVVDGGLLSYTMKKSGSERENRAEGDKAMTGTNVVIESRGVNFEDVEKVAENLEPVSPSPSSPVPPLVPVVMLSSCKQALAAGTYAEARSMASNNGYTMRVSSINGVPSMLTGDWRMKRINVVIVGDRVVSCSYG